MKQKKIKTLITLLNARERTKRALKRYDELYSKQALNLTFQSEIQDTLNYFKINLYNYIRAIKDKKEYFDKYQNLESELNKKVIPLNAESLNSTYTIYELYSVYRNRYEHPNKIDDADQYTIFHTSIPQKEFILLFHICNNVVDFELNKLTSDEIKSMILENPETIISIQKSILHLDKQNEKEKEEHLELYQQNKMLLQKLKNINFNNLTENLIDEIYEEFKNYFLNTYFKKEFVEYYGETMYKKLLEIYNNENGSTKQIVQEIQTFYQTLLKQS